jgi:hypothetical protein
MTKLIKPEVSSEVLEAAAARASQDEQDTVHLIALTMRGSSRLQVPKGMGFYYADVKPLGLSPAIPKTVADSVTAGRTQNDAAIKPAVVWQPVPPQRPKNAKLKSFVREVNGHRVEFVADTFAPPPDMIINGRRIYHSVSQAQNYISHCLTTIPGVERFITEFDTRPAVAKWGNYVINVMRQKEQVNMGLTGGMLQAVS